MFTETLFPITLLLTACSTLVLFSCDVAGVRSEGDVLTEIRTAQDFHALDISVPGKVVVHVGPAYKVEVQGEESALPYLETEVKNGALHVYFSKNVYNVNHLLITVTAPAFDGFDISGSATVVAHDPLDGTALNVDISGSGSMALTDVVYDRADLAVSGSGDILLKGVVQQTIDFDVSGSGTLDALDCPTAKANVELSGSGKVKCDVQEALRVRVSGSGDVLYSGDPALDVKISGSGKVRKI